MTRRPRNVNSGYLVAYLLVTYPKSIYGSSLGVANVFSCIDHWEIAKSSKGALQLYRKRIHTFIMHHVYGSKVLLVHISIFVFTLEFELHAQISCISYFYPLNTWYMCQLHLESNSDNAPWIILVIYVAHIYITCIISDNLRQSSI